MSRLEEEEMARALRREREAIPAHAWLKLLYSLTLIAAVFPLGVAGMSGWVGLTLGTSLLGSFLLPLLAIVLWRVYVVWRHPTTLMRHRSGALIAFLRGVAVVEMVVGCLAALALLLQRPIIAAMGGVRTDDGIEYYMLQLGAVMVGGLGLQGVVIFEWSRLIGMERFYREEAPSEIPARESQAVVWLNAVALGALLLLSFAPVATLLGKRGPSSAALVGLVVAVPVALTIVLRIVSLLVHGGDVPRPVAGGWLGAMRTLAIAGLPIFLLAAVGSVVSLATGQGAFGGSMGWTVMALLGGLVFLGPLALGALEASRLLAYECHERGSAGALP
jgi:hypothetical protein